MIPITAKLEPADFDSQIRTPGNNWLKSEKVMPARRTSRKPVPVGFKFPESRQYWRKCLSDLHQVYGGICAFSGLYIHPVTGSKTVEHFQPKSQFPGLAYEWSNYRLICSLMNGRKSDYEDVLDPFSLKPGTFHLDLASGRIFANPKLSPQEKSLANDTINRLKLDDAECRNARITPFQEYIAKKIDQSHFKKVCPFVWSEAKRQGLL